MRGTGFISAIVPPRKGITPAHAGNSPAAGFFINEIKDHPRTCGEQRAMLAPREPQLGSPPHMRGTVVVHHHGYNLMGITPAHAGNREVENVNLATVGDHPRTCGEQPFQYLLAVQLQGSPPHMRGTAPSLCQHL